MQQGAVERRDNQRPTRREFTELEDLVAHLQEELLKMHELLKINTDITSDMRAILRSSSILVSFIKSLGVVAGALAAIYAAFAALAHYIKG